MKEWKFNKWQYEIKKNQGEGLKGYGYNIYLYKNDILVYSNGAYAVKSIALSDIQKFIIENEFNFELCKCQY